MATSTFWRSVGVAVESARAAAKPLTDSPYVAVGSTCTIYADGHGYTNGDYVYLSIQGMWQLDGRVVRVASAATDTFVAEGVDSTDYDAATGGNVYKLTFGTTLSTGTNITASGGEPEFADSSTIHDAVRQRAPVLSTPHTFGMESIWDPADAGLVALKNASDALGNLAVKFTFSNGRIFVFEGYIFCPMVPTGSFGELVKTPLSIESKGRFTTYAS
jgi:hypothetical protein